MFHFSGCLNYVFIHIMRFWQVRVLESVPAGTKNSDWYEIWPCSNLHEIGLQCKISRYPRIVDLYKGWPVSRKLCHTHVGPTHHHHHHHDANISAMLWVRANPRPLLLWGPPYVGWEKWSRICSNLKHSWDMAGRKIAGIFQTLGSLGLYHSISRLCFELEQIRDHFSI